MAEFVGKGWGALNTVLGSIGAAGATGILNGGLGNLFGGFGCGGNACGYSAPVSRYELEQQNKITEKDMEIAYLRGRDAAKTDTIDTYAYLNSEITKLNARISDQDIKFAKIEGTFAVLGEQIHAQRNEFMCALNRERDERCCGDNSIVTYANATFYGKQVADVTVGTTTTAQAIYNPLPSCGCCK